MYLVQRQSGHRIPHHCGVYCFGRRKRHRDFCRLGSRNALCSRTNIRQPACHSRQIAIGFGQGGCFGGRWSGHRRSRRVPVYRCAHQWPVHRPSAMCGARLSWQTACRARCRLKPARYTSSFTIHVIHVNPILWSPKAQGFANQPQGRRESWPLSACVKCLRRESTSDTKPIVGTLE